MNDSNLTCLTNEVVRSTVVADCRWPSFLLWGFDNYSWYHENIDIVVDLIVLSVSSHDIDQTATL